MSKLRVGFKRAYCPLCKSRICEGMVGTKVILKCTCCKNLIDIEITQHGVQVIMKNQT